MSEENNQEKKENENHGGSENQSSNEQVKEENNSEEEKESSEETQEEDSEKPKESQEEPNESKEVEQPEQKNNVLPKSEKGEGSFMPIVIVMIASLIIAGIPAVNEFIKKLLDPTAGALIGWNLEWGMLVVVLVITFTVTIVQKYATDQETLREIKKEQKALQKELKKLDRTSKEYMDKNMEMIKLIPKQFKLGMRGIIYTGIPFLLFFRWFQDYFDALPDGTKFFGIVGSWFVFYLIFAIIFGSFLRKWMNVV